MTSKYNDHRGNWQVVSAIYDPVRNPKPLLMRVGPGYMLDETGKHVYPVLWGVSGVSGCWVNQDELQIEKSYYSYTGSQRRVGRQMEVTAIPTEVKMAIRYQFDCDHAPQADWHFTPGNGWLSPAGVWYPCASEHHTGIGEQLYNLYYCSPTSYDWENDDSLLKHGWIAIRDSGRNSYPIYERFDNYTIPELQAIRLDQMAKNNPAFKQALDETIHTMNESNIQWLTEKNAKNGYPVEEAK